MKNRRAFLTVLTAISGAAAGLPVAAKARVPATPSAATPAPVASRLKEPSAAALAFAGTCRAFDPALSDAELQTIARAIDESRAAGAKLNPKSAPLRNSDDMVARFSAAESL